VTRAVNSHDPQPWSACACSKLVNAADTTDFWHSRRGTSGHDHLLAAIASLLSFRIRSRASLELEVIALRHQLGVLKRQRPGRSRLFCADRLLWVLLYRISPRAIDAMILVKPTTVLQWRCSTTNCWRRQRFSAISSAFGLKIAPMAKTSNRNTCAPAAIIPARAPRWRLVNAELFGSTPDQYLRPAGEQGEDAIGRSRISRVIR
jgi:hypothetical protein